MSQQITENLLRREFLRGWSWEWMGYNILVFLWPFMLGITEWLSRWVYCWPSSCYFQLALRFLSHSGSQQKVSFFLKNQFKNIMCKHYTFPSATFTFIITNIKNLSVDIRGQVSFCEPTMGRCLRIKSPRVLNYFGGKKGGTKSTDKSRILRTAFVLKLENLKKP